MTGVWFTSIGARPSNNVTKSRIAHTGAGARDDPARASDGRSRCPYADGRLIAQTPSLVSLISFKMGPLKGVPYKGSARKGVNGK